MVTWEDRTSHSGTSVRAQDYLVKEVLRLSPIQPLQVSVNGGNWTELATKNCFCDSRK